MNRKCIRCGKDIPKGFIIFTPYELCQDCVNDLDEFLQGAPVLKWNPIKFRDMTEEERAELEDIGIDTTARTITESTMPEDGQEVLVTLKDGRMYHDTAYNDNLGYYLDSGIDWEDDVIAWAAPEPYKPEKEGGSEDGLPV